jgi:hypothetical protein
MKYRFMIDDYALGTGYLLPKDCPTSRILSFGYNADFSRFYPFYGPKKGSKQLTIDNHSTALFQSLIGLRENTESISHLLMLPCREFVQL